MPVCQPAFCFPPPRLTAQAGLKNHIEKVKNIMTNQVNPSPKSPENQAPAPKFRLYSDGLGTFLSIASERINEWNNNGELTPDETECLQSQINVAAWQLGQSFELLAMERIDYCQVEDSTAICAALMSAGRMMAELGSIGITLESARGRHAREQEKRDGQTAQTMRDIINRGV